MKLKPYCIVLIISIFIVISVSLFFIINLPVKLQGNNYSWDDIFNKKAPFAKGWKFIVLHHSATSAGNAKSFHNYHKEMGFGGLAYHFVIGNGRGSADGKIEKGFRWKKQISGTHVTVDSWYHNVFGIGICLVGNFEITKPTQKQLVSLISLLKKLVKKNKIPRKNILGHNQVQFSEMDWTSNRIIVNFIKGKYQKKACPGKKFPITQILNEVYR